MIDLLSAGELTIRDLSQAVGIPEKEVMGHLSHIDRSIRRIGRKLVETPYKCLTCGFVFDNRTRFSKPGRCPSCRNSHLQTAHYQIK